MVPIISNKLQNSENKMNDLLEYEGLSEEANLVVNFSFYIIYTLSENVDEY